VQRGKKWPWSDENASHIGVVACKFGAVGPDTAVEPFSVLLGTVGRPCSRAKASKGIGRINCSEVLDAPLG
jgi:hypothetical protein